MKTTNCPIPFSDSDCVLLAHGGGGRMTHQLISSIFYPAFRKSLLEQDHGGCVIGVVPKGVHIAPDSRCRARRFGDFRTRSALYRQRRTGVGDPTGRKGGTSACYHAELSGRKKCRRYRLHSGKRPYIG